ncbi:MAG TPA: DUF2279 domain-containing protein, partial [Polyangiaceae bacterium]
STTATEATPVTVALEPAPAPVLPSAEPTALSTTPSRPLPPASNPPNSVALATHNATADAAPLSSYAAAPYHNPALGNSQPLGRGTSVALMLGLYVGMNTLAYLAWWAGSPPDQFEWIHDGWFGSRTYAGGSDKLGHFWGNHLVTRAVAGILEEGGWHPRTSTYAGASLSLGTFYIVEMRDAFSTGFSKNDMISNVAGVAMGILFREFPILDEMFDTRVEYFPTTSYFHKFKKKGFNFTEDYTGMKFLFAWHLSSVPVIERSPTPLRFVDLVLGYHTRNYKPRPDDPHTTRYQDRYVGISLNLQRIVDELWLGKRHPQYGESAGRTHRFVHFATEFLNVPYTSLQLGTSTTESLR